MSALQERPVVTFWWQIKTFDNEIILISIQEATKIKEAMRSMVKVITVRGKTIATRDIRRIEQSEKLVDPFTEQHLIESGAADLKKREPIVNPETGDVMWRWAKKAVSTKKFDAYYSNVPGYITLEREDSHVWMAFRKVLITNEPIGEGVYWCHAEEIKKLPNYSGE